MWARKQANESRAIPRDYLDGVGAFPERLPWLILTGRFPHDCQLMVDQWAEWALGVVEAWPMT
ncbi:hypothetical protein [Nocardioides sp.]|jgi:hypothetical protein|uniref:hypothetical protein n=1 Tax=Nocardioides sp. TaxID=35761 RepID=UPI002F420A59